MAHAAELVPDKNQTVRASAVAVLHRVYADIDNKCVIRHVATAPRLAQHQLLQALLSTLPDLPQQVCILIVRLLTHLHIRWSDPALSPALRPDRQKSSL